MLITLRTATDFCAPEIFYLLPQAEPNCSGPNARREVRKRTFPVKGSRAPRGLEAIARHDFQSTLREARAICRKENFCIPLGHFEGRQEQLLEILLDVKHLSPVRSREGRRIKDNDIKLFPFSTHSGQDLHDIVGEEAMAIRRQRIQSKVFPSARQRFF